MSTPEPGGRRAPAGLDGAPCRPLPPAALADGYPCELPLPADRALVVTGSVFAKETDRLLQREAIWPVQVILDGRAHPARRFLPVGSLGVSSFAFADPEDPAAPIFYSSGQELWELSGGVGGARLHALPELIDVHEMAWHRGWVHLANTGRDEIVSFEAVSGACRRRSLAGFRGGALGQPRSGERVVDRFHANQAFLGLDGDLWALVHHVTGTQSLLTAVEGVIKRQGDGGVLNLDRQRAVRLDLAGPHSVRIVGQEYWVMNSGAHEVVVYSRDWRRLRAGPTLGWGRGLAIHANIAYGGVTPTRRRYLALFERADPRCWLQAIGLDACDTIVQALVRNVEQINNVYCVDRAVGVRLLSS